jgi:hypothetical protein
VRIWYVVAGVVCILMGVGAFFVPAIVHLEDNHNGSEHTVDKVQPVAAPVHAEAD